MGGGFPAAHLFMKYKARRSIYTGDPGRHVKPGEVFDVPDWQVKEYEQLEASGIIERYIERTRVDRKMYQVFPNKMMKPVENK